MALYKNIKQSNGVETKYHRIVMVKIDTNQQISLLIHSYIDTDGRNYEKSYAAGLIEGEPVFPYVSAEYKTLEYDENMNIKNAYKYLKTLPEFEGAEDV